MQNYSGSQLIATQSQIIISHLLPDGISFLSHFICLKNNKFFCPKKILDGFFYQIGVLYLTELLFCTL